MAAVVFPVPPRSVLPVDKSASSAQVAPFQSSVASVKVGVAVFPPNAKAEELLGPPPAKFCLAVFTLLTSVQLDTFHV